MRLITSRRITGPHLVLDGPGAAAEVLLDEGEDLGAVAELLGRVEGVVRGLGWPWRPAARPWPGGATVGFLAPPDQLDSAAWVFDHLLAGEPDLDGLRAMAAAEANPALRRAVEVLGARGVPHFYDEDGLTVGLGRHARTWPLSDLPDPEAVTGARVPFAFVTGTNGKTTTTRLLARIGKEAGLVVGHTSSDGVCVDGAVVERGDWTGPGAARQVLRRPEVELAVLETARGGLMRRGLVITGADAAIVTNVSPDHLGEWGIMDTVDTARAKLVVARGLRPGGRLVTNALDPVLAVEAAPLAPWWFGVDAGRDAGVERGWIVLRGEPLVPLDDVPLTLGGRVGFNVENALAAALGAEALGLPREAIAAGLRGFRPNPRDNAGRMNVVAWRGARVIVDFAHNPDGLRRLGDVVAAFPGGRRVLVMGQAGDRRDEDILDLADAAVAIGFDHYVIKELPDHLRGRALGEVPSLLRARLVAAGVPASAIVDAQDELAGARRALSLAAPGDVVLLLTHERYDDVMALLAAG